ncbi:MAG: putative PEP-binding protein [Phycisphaerae bacterium]
MAGKTRAVYYFGNGKAVGKGDQRELLGGKGAGLAEMTRIGLPVPCGFTITTDTCAAYNRRGGKWPTGLEKEIRQALAKMERACKKKFGAAKNPLLVSVRSGAARSMPGMMDTILNLGLNDKSVEGLANASGNRRFALDSYRRLIMMYGATARGVPTAAFEEAFDHLKETRTRPRLGGVSEKITDADVNEQELEALVTDFKRIYRDRTGDDFPQDPFSQLKGAVSAVFDSWMADKAVTYRKVENITGLNGTAVNVCQMVFGNMGDDCGTGVCFTRDPSTGEAVLYGEALINAQGEDVVAGVRTPIKLDEFKKHMPAVYDQLEAVRVMLEVHYKEMQDLEFTVERGKLFMLQCRVGKRSPGAAFRIAVDQATRGLMTTAAARRLFKKGHLPKKYVAAASRPVITKDEAIQRIDAADVERLFYPVLNPTIAADELTNKRLGEGIGAVPGAACGQIAMTADTAQARAADGSPVVLVRKETSPEDVGGMDAAVGILTATGGKTSHAAVVARGWGKCCIVGCDQLQVDQSGGTITLNGRLLREGDTITLNGSTGEIFSGSIPLVRPQSPPEFKTLMAWCDTRRKLRVRTNADTPADAARAVELGAEGIGLCRTEHMFFDSSEPQRIAAMREMILADGESDRRRALDKLLAFQRADFEGIFAAMKGKPVTVRLLDPPLHEFLPQHDNRDAQEAVAAELNAHIHGAPSPLTDGDGEPHYASSSRTITVSDIQRRVDQLHEANPMLGHRGCRLCISFPEILEMQVRAIMEAAVACTRRKIKVLPEIMIPLTVDAKELRILVERTRAVADLVLKENKARVSYLVGTMIETPRAAITADTMAREAEFFSFGTNDLTQLAMGLSRDDAGRFLPEYVDENKAGIFPGDPFQSLDVAGVGRLMRMAVEEGRSTRPKIKLGICGEHGGDPASVRFCQQLSLDYVSCSPLRVPIARLAAAQAAIEVQTIRPRIVKSNAKPRSVVRPSRTKTRAKTRPASTKKRATKKSASRKKRKRARA